MSNPAANAVPSESRSTLPAADRESGPCLVLISTDRSALRATIDAVCVEHATTFDVRAETIWVEVANPCAFLQDLAHAFADGGDRRSIRVGWAPVDAPVEHLVERALRSQTLDEIADHLDERHLLLDPPLYEVHYQPVIRLEDRTVIGFESLIRARQQARHLNAEELIRAAGRGGWLPEFDQLARTLAVRGVGDWLGDGLLFLNVMAPDGLFDLEDIATTVRQAVAAGLEPDQLVLEAVERNRYRSLDEAAEQIAELRELGVRIAVDDVGDGFAGLSVLTRFLPDVVKISGTVVERLPSTEGDAVIGALVGLAHETGAWVVAENIENEQQVDALIAAGVDWGQGHFLGSPAGRDSSPATRADLATG